MRAELDEALGWMRYTCPTCHRCLEDGPDGLRVLRRGDLDAVHTGGTLEAPLVEVEGTGERPPPTTTLH